MNSRVTVAALTAVILVIMLSYVMVTNNHVIIQPPEPKIGGNVGQSPSPGGSRQQTGQVLHEPAFQRLVTKGKVSDLCPGTDGNIPHPSQIDGLSVEKLRVHYRDYGSNSQVVCNVMLRMGNLGDGGWEVCDDEPVKPRQNCLVYSFGINNDFSFDDMISKHYGCEVHAFDPSMKMGDTRRSDKVSFHHLGVYGSNTVIHGSWPVKTIAEIRRMLGHTNRRIDVMKMDVEGSEWVTLDTALSDGSLNNVTQFLFEIHNFSDDKPSLASKLKTLHRLRDLGFRTFYAHKNPQCSIGQKTETPLRSACLELQMMYIPACRVK